MRFVGGDLFDVLVGPEGQTAFFVSDVSGHGVSAALITAMVKTSILGQAQHLGSIADLVNRVNQVVCGLAGADRFVTAFFGLLDAQGGQLHYINAGHPPALLARRGERAVEHLQPTEVPLGFLDDVEYSPAATSVAPGDRIVLYTDGITEAPGAAEEQYGVGRLEQSLMAHAGLPLDELVEKTIQDLIQFHGRDTFDDDVNLLVCEVAEA
jgi:serine phosphatase RsbU (regulator of sigma subunit)